MGKSSESSRPPRRLRLTLPELLTQHALHSFPALIERGKTVSFAALAEESRRVAGGLYRLGVAPGDRVALWLPSTTAWLTVFFACAQLGAISIAVNTRFRSHELTDVLARSGAKTLVFWPNYKGIDFGGTLAGCDAHALERLQSVVAYSEDGMSGPRSLAGKAVFDYATLSSGEPFLENRARADAACVMFTTSGTTNAPKFVLHSHRAVIRHALDVARGFAIGADSILLLIPPLCGVYGFCSAMAALAAGRPVMISPVWDPEEAARDIVAHSITHASGTDDAVAQLLEQSHAEHPFPSLRFFSYAPFNPSLGDMVERADARGMKLVGLYGSSEVQALFSRQHEDAPLVERRVAGGLPVSVRARVRARDPETATLLPHGKAGELEFYAPSSSMIGYFGDAEATSSAFTEDGYFRSGDLGHTQPDGRFVFLTRVVDSLRLGGFLVSPAEIESVMQEVPGIAGCQVVGIPAQDGLEPIAFVLLESGANLDECAAIQHVAARLARYKVPRRIFAIDAFPVTPGTNATKVQKHKLRDMAQQLVRG